MNIDLSNKRCITHEQLNMLIVEQGQLDIHVHKLQGHYVPFVFFTQPNTTKTPYGPIVSEGSIVACSELDDLLAALEESFGTRAKIYAPGTKPPPGAQLH